MTKLHLEKFSLYLKTDNKGDSILANSNLTAFELYIPIEFVHICKFKTQKIIYVYKSKTGDIYLSKRKTSNTICGTTYINHENNIVFNEELCTILNLEEDDVLAIYVKRKRLFLELIATKR